MNNPERELLLLVAASVLTPILGCLIAVPVFLVSKSAFWTIAIGSLLSICFYMGVYLLNRKLEKREEKEIEKTEKEAKWGSPHFVDSGLGPSRSRPLSYL